MGVGTFAGRTFRVDPYSVQWTFSTKTKDTPTVGGKVIQVFGTSISDLVVEGEFGVGGWQQQEAFLVQMKQIADGQAYAGRHASQRQPSRFTYPPRGWNFLVYLKTYDNPESGGKAVRHSAGTFNPKWRLTLAVEEDISALGIKKVAQDAYVARLAKGIGWKQTQYNGPDVAITPASAGTGTSVTDAQTGGNVYRGMGNQKSDVERWRSLVELHFAVTGNVDEMMCIMKYESGGNPDALNQKGSSARGLFQIMSSVWADSFGVAPDDFYNPTLNVKYAKRIYDLQGYGAWPNTSKKCGL